jgi:hypothetical protein
MRVSGKKGQNIHMKESIKLFVGIIGLSIIVVKISGLFTDYNLIWVYPGVVIFAGIISFMDYRKTKPQSHPSSK